MDDFLKFLGTLVLGTVVLGILAALGPIGAIIAFFLIGALVAGKLQQAWKQCH